MKKPKLEYIPTNLKRYTFECPKIKEWVEKNSYGKVLNLFAGKTKLNIRELRNDIDSSMNADYHYDAVDLVKKLIKKKIKFNTIILDPPYSYRKSMEMYNGHKASRFKILADLIPNILYNDNESKVITFGYHSTFLGKKRGYRLTNLCLFGHGGAQHCTIAIIEKKI